MALALIWPDRKEENGSPGTMATAGFPHSGRQSIDVMQNLVVDSILWSFSAVCLLQKSPPLSCCWLPLLAAAADWDATVVCEGLPITRNS